MSLSIFNSNLQYLTGSTRIITVSGPVKANPPVDSELRAARVNAQTQEARHLPRWTPAFRLRIGLQILSRTYEK